MSYTKLSRIILCTLAVAALFLTTGCPTGAQGGAPTAAFTASVNVGAAPLAVQFTDDSLAGSDSITSWSWNFGDGATSTAQNPSHTYTAAGTYTVSLTVTSSSGSDTDSQQGFINVTADVAPTANFTVSTRTGVIPLDVQFTDTSGPGSGSITSWSWNFGDGGTSANQNPTHTYTVAGVYTISLTVTGTSGSNNYSAAAYIDVTNNVTEQTTMLPGNVPLVMVWVPGGTFTMGSPDTEEDRSSSEGPQHQVTVQGFWMGKYDVTQLQWQALMGNNPSYFQGAHVNGADSSNRPVDSVSWDDAHAFIGALNSYTGKVFRLPSEAEWEYACRAGTTTRFFWGDDPYYQHLDDFAWYSIDSYDANLGNNITHDVGLKLPNMWGLYGMNGSIEQWCEDDWHSDYTGAPTDGSAWVDSPRGQVRALRGAGPSDGYIICRSASRWYDIPTDQYMMIGLRLAK